jgi:hypothetical protein
MSDGTSQQDNIPLTRCQEILPWFRYHFSLFGMRRIHCGAFVIGLQTWDGLAPGMKHWRAEHASGERKPL